MTNEERKVIELALEALLKTQNEGFNLPGSSIREAITAIKEALAQQDQDEVDIRSRLYQRIHELETQLAQPEQEPTTGNILMDSYKAMQAKKLTAQPEQKPVAYIHRNEFNEYRLEPTDNFKITDLPVGVEMMLYTTPPQRKPLTDEQMWVLWNSQGDDAMEQQAAIAFARAIEAAHGIKGEA